VLLVHWCNWKLNSVVASKWKLLFLIDYSVFSIDDRDKERRIEQTLTSLCDCARENMHVRAIFYEQMAGIFHSNASTIPESKTIVSIFCKPVMH
jgi:hypothetical protein